MNNSCIISLTADPITVGHRDIIKQLLLIEKPKNLKIW